MELNTDRQQIVAGGQGCTSDEIDLVQLVKILLKRKWLIVAVTVILTVSAAGIVMMMPKVYAVSAILESARDAEGNLIESPQTIRESIVSGAYDRLIINDLHMDIADFPKFKVTVPKSTDLVKIAIESSATDNALSVLASLLHKIKNGIDSKLEIKKKFLQNELKSAEITKKLLPAQIGQLDKLVEATEQKLVEMEKLRNVSMSGGTSDSMAVLLSLNEIQNKQVFLNGLYREIAELKQADELATVAISDKRLKLTNLKGLSIRKPPEVSDKPIKPKKVLIVALALVLGMMGGVMLAFGAEFMAKVKS